MLEDKLNLLKNKKVWVFTSNYNVAYCQFKGILIGNYEEYIEIDDGKKKVIIPKDKITSITYWD